MNWGLRRRWPFTPSTGNCLHCCLLCKRGVSLQPVSAVSYTSETLVILVTRETVWYCTWLILVCLSCLVAGRFWFVAFDLSKVSQYGLSVAKIMLCDGKLYECINRPSNRNSFHWNGNGNSLMVSDVGRTHTHTHTDTHTHTHTLTNTHANMLTLHGFLANLRRTTATFFFDSLGEWWSRKPLKLRTMSCLLSVWIPARAFGLSYFSCILNVLEDCQAFTSVFAYCLIAHFKNWSTDKASAEPMRNRCSTPLVEWWRTICSYIM